MPKLTISCCKKILKKGELEIFVIWKYFTNNVHNYVLELCFMHHPVLEGTKIKKQKSITKTAN